MYNMYNNNQKETLEELKQLSLEWEEKFFFVQFHNSNDILQKCSQVSIKIILVMLNL